MKPKAFLCVSFAALLLLALSVMAQTQPASPSTAPANTDSHVWELSDYLRGTTDQIRQKVNHEVERLSTNLANARQRLADAKKQLVDAQAAAVQRADADPQVKSLQAQLSQLQELLDTARSSGSAQEKLDASAKYVTCKQEVESRQKKVIAEDADIVRLQKSLLSLQQDIDSTARAVGAAEKWRRELIDAITNTYRLDWPLIKDKAGIVQSLTVKQIIRDNTFLASCVFNENQSIQGESEGIVTISVLMHPVDVYVVGMDTSQLHVGQVVDVNHTMVVVKSVLTEDADALPVLKKADGDVDKLLAALNSVKTDLSTADLDNLVALSETKENPKTWTSLKPIIDELPAEFRNNFGKKWDVPELQRVNDWLSKNIAHDRVDMTLTLQSGKDNGSGTFTLVGVYRILGSNTNHIVEMRFADIFRPRVKYLRPGAEIHAKGTIDSIQMRDDSTLIVKVIHASF